MLQIHRIPAFSDNYFWLIQPDPQKPTAYIVDPGDAGAVKQKLHQLKLSLAGILLTHHHHDHIDGAEELHQSFQIPVYGPKSARIPQVTHPLHDGDQLHLGKLTFHILGLAGHTLDHIGYYLQPEGTAPLLFSGDTIFAAGCGRLFDGTAELLYEALQRIAQLPDETIIYCAHEYTLTNLQFARHIEPDNIDIANRQADEMRKRKEGLATIPTTLSLEKRTNPFLRCHLPAVREQVERLADHKFQTNAEVFASLRRAKDRF